MPNLTAKQQQIYDLIRASIQETGHPPTFREIGEALGLRSPSTVQFHLRKLEAAGLIRIPEGKTRAITLLSGDDAPAPQRMRIPVLGSVAAGAPIWADQTVEEYVDYEALPRPEEYFALRVRGESMTGAGIMPDDLVVVHRQPEAAFGEIVVALFEDEANVKTFSHREGKIWLMPENPAYDPIDGEGAVVIGKVIGLMRKYQ